MADEKLGFGESSSWPGAPSVMPAAGMGEAAMLGLIATASVAYGELDARAVGLRRCQRSHMHSLWACKLSLTNVGGTMEEDPEGNREWAFGGSQAVILCDNWEGMDQKDTRRVGLRHDRLTSPASGIVGCWNKESERKPLRGGW